MNSHAKFSPLSRLQVEAASLAILLPSLASPVAAQEAGSTPTGTVTNGTTNKPAVGDEVILINLANGMDVAGGAKATRPGKFGSTLASFTLASFW